MPLTLPPWLGGLLTLGIIGAATAQVASLHELAELARRRFEQSKQEQLTALQPFLKDLELDYQDRSNREYLESKFPTIASLGDSIVPALLERLTPAEASPAAINVAANSARVLRLLDVSGFADALLELAEADSNQARLHALRLLGATRSPAASKALARMLDKLQGQHQIAAIHSLSQLKASEPAPRIAELLGSQDQELRVAAIDYLASTQAPAVLPQMLQALAQETSPDLIPAYVRYIEAVAPQNAGAAEALLPLLQSQQLDRALVIQVCQALARVAPKGHAGTIAACKQVLDGEETGPLGLACAMAMKSVGDNTGVNLLMARLNALIVKNKRTQVLFIHRGDLQFALGRWERAARDYEDAIRESGGSSVVRQQLYLTLAKCEARLQRWGQVLSALRDSGASAAKIRQLASADEALTRAMKHAPIRKFVESLAKTPGGGG